MKRVSVLMFAAVSALSVCGAAPIEITEVCSTNIFGVLPVYSTTVRTVVSVPWVASEAGNHPISVSNLVCTVNLTAGDQLYVYDGSQFLGYVLANGRWQDVANVTESGVAQSPSASESVLPRGGAMILSRQAPTDGSGAAIPFYIYGQVGSSAAGVSTTVVAGTKASPAYSLLAPPRDSAWYVNDLVFTGAIGADDEIVVVLPNGIDRPLVYKSGTWGYYNPVFKAYSGQIKAGVGCWYVSRGGSPTISWESVVPVTESVK